MPNVTWSKFDILISPSIQLFKSCRSLIYIVIALWEIFFFFCMPKNTPFYSAPNKGNKDVVYKCKIFYSFCEDRRKIKALLCKCNVTGVCVPSLAKFRGEYTHLIPTCMADRPVCYPFIIALYDHTPSLHPFICNFQTFAQQPSL